MSNNPQFIRGAIIALIIAGVIGVLTVLAGDSLGTGDFTGKLFLVSFSLIFFSITAAISMVVTEKQQYKGLGNAGMIVSLIAFFITLILIFAGVGDDEDPILAKLAFALFIASIALAHICLLHHFNLRNRHAHNARMTATIFISIFALVIIITVLGSGDGFQMLTGGQSVMKLGMGSLVADLAATALVPLCNRLPVDEQPTLSFDNENKPAEAQPEQPQGTGEGDSGINS